MIPAHYDDVISPLEYMRATFSEQAYIGFLKGNIFKYLARAGKKGSAYEDYQKAQVYLDELVRYASVM